jgi:ABC-type Fe3+ transport system permease subunit
MPNMSHGVDKDAKEEDRSWQADGRPNPARHHLWMLAIAGTIVILAFALVEVPHSRVALRGFTDHPLPETCVARRLFGLRCPGCGLTRSTIHLAEGDWRASWRSHRLGGLFAALVAFQIPYRLIALRRPDRLLIPTRRLVLFGYLLIALLMGNWLFDLVAVPFESH